MLARNFTISMLSGKILNFLTWKLKHVILASTPQWWSMKSSRSVHQQTWTAPQSPLQSPLQTEYRAMAWRLMVSSSAEWSHPEDSPFQFCRYECAIVSCFLCAQVSVSCFSKREFLLFPECTKTCCQSECTHTDEERAINGTFTTPELKKALSLGYIVTEVFHVSFKFFKNE